MTGFCKILCVLIRNEIKYKPSARRAKNVLTKELRERRWNPRSVKISLGLADPSFLACLVIFQTDAELGAFEASGQKADAVSIYRSALAKDGYPITAIDQVDVSFHSWETIEKAGGLYFYSNQ